jgi:hypothetical protein
MQIGREDRESPLHLARESSAAKLEQRKAAPASGSDALARPACAFVTLAIEGHPERVTAEVFGESQRASEGLTGPSNLTLTPWLR